MSGTTDEDTVLATVSTGSGTTQQTVDLSSPTRIVGTYVATSTFGIGTNPLVIYNWDPSTQLAGFLSAQAAGTASIVAIGDSWTSGFGASAGGWTELSYSSEMAQALQHDGVAAQTDNFLGSPSYISNGEDDDNRVTMINGASDPFVIVAGGTVIGLSAVGQGFNFSLDSPENYNQVTISYVDAGNGSVSFAVDGGPVVGTVNFGNTGQTLTQTINIPAGMHSELTVLSTSANPSYIQGVSFSSTTSPSISVYNAGIGGWDSTSANTSTYDGSNITGSADGYGQTASSAALHPSLAIIDLGSNDIALAEDTTAQTLTNISQIVATLRSVGTDVIVMIPQPFGSAAYATELPALRAGLEQLSISENFPLIDLSATYDNSEVDLEAAGLKSDLLHGDATLYADIGSQIAALLTNVITNVSSNSGDYVTQSVSANNATIVGTATVNTLIGKGTNDTYIVNATDQSDTILNGSSTSKTASNILDFNAATHNQLWFEQSGSNLVIDVLGTNQQTVVRNWFSSNGAQLQEIVASDELRTDSGIQSLIQAMATFCAATPGFNPSTTKQTVLTDSYFGVALSSAESAAWHM